MKTKLFPLIMLATLLLLMLNNRVDSGINNSSKLLELAWNKFKGELYPAEQKLIKMTGFSKEAIYIDSNQVNKQIRADRIVWLCTDRQALEVITYRGIQIRNAYIDGNIDLRYAKIPFPVSFIDCNFPMEINLEYANVPALYLSGSSTNKLLADGLKVGHKVIMNNGFTSKGTVSLNGAKIGIDLDCGNAKFNDLNVAFIADGLWVGHKIIMNNNFESKGKVRFTGATIGVALDCSNGTFRDFIANGLKIERSIYMHNKSSISDGVKMQGMLVDKGTVSLVDATIGGILDCRGARFIAKRAKRSTRQSDPNGDAFIGTGLKIERTVHMEGATFEGRVKLISAEIGGILDCTEAEFNNPNGYALIATGISVEGTVNMEESTFKGEMIIDNAKIGGNFNCKNSYFINPNGIALNATGIKVEGDADMENFQVSGKVSLRGAKINRNFVWKGVTLGKNVEVDLRSAKIGALWDDPNSWSDPTDKNNPRLLLCGLIYDDLHEGAPTNAKDRIKWLLRQDPNRFMPQPYEQLATVLRNHGFYEDARKILISKTDDWLKSPQSKMPWYKRRGYRILKTTISYGYRPWRIHSWGIGIVVLGCFLYSIGNYFQFMKRTKKFPKGEAYPKFNPFIYSVDVFTPVINLCQAAYWVPDQCRRGDGKVTKGSLIEVVNKIDRIVFKGFLSKFFYKINDKVFKVYGDKVFGWFLCVYFWLQIISGWIIMTLFLTGLSGLIKI